MIYGKSVNLSCLFTVILLHREILIKECGNWSGILHMHCIRFHCTQTDRIFIENYINETASLESKVK